MIVEKNDVAAVRLAEARGLFPTDGELAEVGLKREEFRARLAQLVSAGVVKSVGVTVCVPPLLGGDHGSHPCTPHVPGISSVNVTPL